MSDKPEPVPSPSSSHQPLVTKILAALRLRYAGLNRHYEAAWTESFVHLRCYHQHATLIEAARCAEKQRQPGWYCIAVEFDEPRQLNAREEKIVNEFRFGPHFPHPNNALTEVLPDIKARLAEVAEGYDSWVQFLWRKKELPRFVPRTKKRSGL